MREQVIEQILQHKIVAIVRGVNCEDAVKTAKALYEGGIRLVEVTFNQKDPANFSKTCDAIRAIREELGDRMLVGAGTVTTPELVQMAADAGALYIISPDTDVEVIEKTRQLGLVSLPGAYTATEAKQAWKAGADFVKIFPCIEGAPAYVKALCAPFNHIRFLAVGGVNADNAATFLQSGAVGVGVGGCLVNKKGVEAGHFDLTTAEAKKFVENIKNA